MLPYALPLCAVLAGGVALAACAAGPGTPPRSAASDRVTLSGVAADAKGGAVLQTDDGAVLYVVGLDAWPAELRGRRVEVTGRHARKKLIPDPVVSPAGEQSAGALGEQEVIEAASWRAAP